MITTTLNAIKAHNPCEHGWKQLLHHLGKTEADDEPLPFLVGLDSNGICDALWATRAAPEHDKLWRMMVVFCARDALQFTNDWRAVQAVQIAERYAHGMASKEQLEEASDAANDAYRNAASRAESSAAIAAASAAANYVTGYATSDVATVAAWFGAPRTTGCAASAAARYDAVNAAKARQEEYFRRLVG